ncbi:MAG: hypothetical protein ABI648_08955 [Betaproteobacteria bacterium]
MSIACGRNGRSKPLRRRRRSYLCNSGSTWNIGGTLTVFNRRTDNGGIAFVGMIPLVTCDFGRFKLNAVHLAKVARYNEIVAFAFYIGIPFGL